MNDLLSLASSKNPELKLLYERIDLAGLLNDLLQEFSPKADEKGVQLQSYLPTPLHIRSSTEGLKTVFRNLLDNAIKYTPQGGSVSLNAHAKDSGVEITIADTGIGIPADSLASLGEEFFRAPNARHTGLPGTGLGLSIVNQVLDRLHGRLRIQSSLGNGTTVMIRLETKLEDTTPE